MTDVYNFKVTTKAGQSFVDERDFATLQYINDFEYEAILSSIKTVPDSEIDFDGRLKKS